MASFYRIGVPFSCLDHSAVIPWTRVNDDYCDCRDGSDEPGTPSCPNGWFHCKDVQYKSVVIPSSRVNDGICDCCDGSDEYATNNICVSNCGALAAAIEEEKSAKRSELVKGHQIYKKYVKDLAIELEQKRKEEALAAEARLEAERLQEMEKAQQPPSPQEPEHSVIPEVPVASDADKAREEEPDVSAQSANEEVASVDEASAEKTADEYSDDSHGRAPTDQPDSPHESPEAAIDYGPDNSFMMLNKECLSIDDREYTYRLCPFTSVHQSSLGSSGSGTNLGKWGKWIGPGHDEDLEVGQEKHYSVMLYEHGDGCWNGPARSTKVFVRCSDVTKLTSVSEPSRCEYAMHLLTPAACYEEPEKMFLRMHPEL